MSDLASFAKISTGPEDEGLFWNETTQAGLFRAGVRWMDGEVMKETLFIGAAFDQWTLAQVHFNATSAPCRVTSDTAPALPENHVQIAP